MEENKQTKIESIKTSVKEIWQGFLENGEILSEESLVNNRLKICAYCEYLSEKGICDLCGCNVSLKSRLKYVRCPARKWDNVS